MATHSLDIIKALEVHTKGKDGDFIAVNHFTKEGGLFEFDSNDITENLIKSRNELMNAYEGLFLTTCQAGCKLVSGSSKKTNEPSFITLFFNNA
jgi:hypothetical protein